MPKLVTLNFVGNRRPWSNDAHVAPPNIEELREFVKAGLAQNLSDPRHSIIAAEFICRLVPVAEIRIGLSLDVLPLKLTVARVVDARVHRAKFVEQKYAPVHADAFLLVENGPPRIEFDQQSNHQPKRRQQHERDG